jgi:hypothetical protein
MGQRHGVGLRLCAPAVNAKATAAPIKGRLDGHAVCTPIFGLAEQRERNARHIGDDHQIDDEHPRKIASGRISCSILMRAMPQAMNRLTPTGGVTIPTARLTIMIRPKWTGSMP